jgi:hypothetical protein
MTESLLSLSNIQLFGQLVEDLQVIGVDPDVDSGVVTNVNAATTPTPPPLPALNGPQIVDGVNLVPNDSVLVKDLGNPNNNGVYAVVAGAWVRDETIIHGSVVAVAAGGAVNGGTNWLVERRVVGPNIHYRFYDLADRGRTVRRRGVNRQLGEQISAVDAGIAKIYGFSYEGKYYDLARPTLFLVHGDGEVVTRVAPIAGAPPHGSHAPREPSLTGLSASDFDFADDLRVWSYDKADYSIRMDVETGMFEQLLLEAELDEEAIEAFYGGQRARVSGQRARVSGQRARVSGQRVRNRDRGD